MARLITICSCFVLALGTACLGTHIDGESSEDDLLGSTQSALTMTTSAQVDDAVEYAFHGSTAYNRAGGADGGNDGTGRVSWKQGGYTSGSGSQVSTCNYGWCGWPSIGSGCNGKEGAWGFSYGACNSSAMGQLFAGRLTNVNRPSGSGENVHSNYKEGVDGTTTFGYHPYWKVNYGGDCRVYQGWSYATHGSCTSYSVTTGPPPSCGDGTCNGSETCGSCPGDCGACPSCGDGTCNGAEDCSSCAGDCGVCPPGINLSNLSGGDKYYTLNVPADGDVVTITITGGSGDCDLHVKKNSSVSTGSYDCRPYKSGNNETCTFSGGGTYNILLDQYSSWSGVSLNAAYTTAGCAPSCSGDQCGQDDGCGGTCSSADSGTCGKCGNAACCVPSCSGDSCGQADGCGGSCSSADSGSCGMCGNAACPTGGECATTSSCGGSAPSGCWCDSLCAGYGDCCDQKVADCG